MNPPIRVPELRAGAAHLWEVNLDQGPFDLALSDDERARADLFHFERDRARFKAGRSALRVLAAAYLNTPFREITFDYGPAGKPFIAGCPVQFNLAHSGPFALIGFARGRHIGVDIEEPRELPDLVDTARAAFAPGEFRRWQNSEAPDRIANFYRCWTRKEAYLKALGEGIARRLHHFEVAFEPNEPPRILAGAEGSWTVADISGPPRYFGAMAVEGNLETLERHFLTPPER